MLFINEVLDKVQSKFDVNVHDHVKQGHSLPYQLVTKFALCTRGQTTDCIT